MSDIVQDETPRDAMTGVAGYDTTGEEAGTPPAADGAMGAGTYEGDAPEGDAPQRVPVRALIDERRKRQEAEQQLAALSGPLSAPRPGDDFPGGWAGGGAGGHASPVAPPPHVEDARMEGAEHAARSRYADFDHKLDAFTRAALARPELIQQMRGAADPGEFAYRVGQAALGEGRGGGPARPPDLRAFEARVRADERARIEALQRAAPLTESLSGVQSAAVHGDEHGWRPTPLEDILGG